MRSFSRKFRDSLRGTDLLWAAASREGQMAGYFLNLTIPVTLIVLGFGALLLYDSVSFPGPSQLLEVMGGALLLAFGLIAACAQVRPVLRWMQAWREQNDRSW